MSEFEFSTLGMLFLLLLALVVYSYWQVHRAKRASQQHESAKAQMQTIIDDGVFFEVQEMVQPAPASLKQALPQEVEVVEPEVQEMPVVVYHVDEPEPVAAPMVEPEVFAPVAVLQVPMAPEPEPDVQFFSQQDESEHAALTIFEPIMRLATWVQAAQPAPVLSIDGIVDLTLSQPKLMHDIEAALEDLRLDTDLPLRLFGRRAGVETAVWHPLEASALYSGLRLTLQLANTSVYADTDLIQDWFILAQRFTKRLAATVHAWPDPAAMASYAVYLHDLAKRLAQPVVIQLHKPFGLWPAFEVHQYMTQTGLSLTEQGQYQARAQDGKVMYCVLNDINNPRAQDFMKDALPTMHANMLSFCVDLARVDAAYQPSAQLLQDMQAIASGLQATWCNAHGAPVDVPSLMAHAQVQISAYYQQLHDLNMPAGSLMLRRLLRA